MTINVEITALYDAYIMCFLCQAFDYCRIVSILDVLIYKARVGIYVSVSKAIICSDYAFVAALCQAIIRINAGTVDLGNKFHKNLHLNTFCLGHNVLNRMDDATLFFDNGDR